MSESMPGMGVMVGMLSGNAETVAAHNGAVGKEIVSVAMIAVDGRYRSMGESPGDTMEILFADGTGIHVFDDGQSCCEHRYAVCDDDLTPFVGAKFVGAEVRDGPTEDHEYGDLKECQFLVVNTDRGSFTVANYNEHNGYYGGFWLVVRAALTGETRE